MNSTGEVVIAGAVSVVSLSGALGCVSCGQGTLDSVAAIGGDLPHVK